jgi:tetratricopeptide (TPR) repeat protein
MKVQFDAGLSQVYEFLEAGNPGYAKPLVEDALAGDLENEEIIFALRCVHFWIDKIPVTEKTGESETKFENGEYLIYQWKHFLSFAGKLQAKHERVMRAICKGVFSAALDCYEQALNVYQTSQKNDIYRRAGLCYKKLGEYERALSFLAEANKLTPDQSEILAEMADCYALCGDERTAKVLFREAFFIAAPKIEIGFLDSEMIRRLIERVETMGLTGNVLLEWIPVYGVLYGVFTVKRELRLQEAVKLKQAIYQLETELKETGCNRAVIVPKLINHYFWFIDHLIARQEERSKIEETLLKIKLLDADVHKKYTGIKPA